MNIKQFCEGIKLDPAARRQLEEFTISEEEYLGYKQHFYMDHAAFFESVKQTAGYRKLLLYLFVRFAVDVYEKYKLQQIDDAIYYDTFSDFQNWCMQCKADTGEYGIEEYNWLKEHVQLRLFRLGRLQFQPLAFDRELIVNDYKIRVNQIVLNVHIPAGDPLLAEQVERSFEMAKAFFRGIPPVFICHSWLLEPELGEILPPESNILRFQQHFHLYKIDKNAKQAEERIFRKTCDNPHDYEAVTRLQRSAKAFLIAGGKLGIGFGIKVIEN
ncbi:acyltransferase domain-containing protein [Paenibacillus nasutitermitis]|uniref:Uncharacterized protein n=1 Tax=Paenibacillus nasutitermitis TaxID=1652958 RepID=A0A917DN09_9BACL|nr:acyltransferase domain-containing protein [Paenibacillus nasutitermitis]GGD53284.1 hypothetical protein GCM10010911_08560 [Paenibacillus nasutitermitis]